MRREKRSAPDGAEACYCLAGRRSARQITRLYERHLAAAGMTSSQFSILAHLRPTMGTTVASLADAMGMERTTIVRLLKPLRTRNWIVEGEKDGRAAALLITRSGLAQLRRAQPYWDVAQQEFEATVGPETARRYREASSSVLSGMTV